MTDPGALTGQSTRRKTFSRRFVIDVTWHQPADQSYAEDWGAVIGDAIAHDATALYDLEEGPLLELKPIEVTDGAG